MEQYLFRIEQLYSLYQIYIFLCQQKETPEIYKNASSNGAKRFQFAKENFFILILSQLYSLFDKRGLDLTKVENPDELLDEIIADWKKIENQITRIRHNLGFHGSKTIQGTKNATGAFAKLDEDGIRTAIELIPKLKKFANQKYEENR